MPSILENYYLREQSSDTKCIKRCGSEEYLTYMVQNSDRTSED